MVPTRRGLFFIGIGVVTYLLAQQSNVGWFYVADAFVWAVLLVNLALPRWTLWGLGVHRRLGSDRGAATEGLFEGDAVRFTLQVTNPGRVPRYFFSVADHCPLEAPDSQTKRALVGYVAPGSSVPWSYAAECYQRGEYQFGPVRLECSAPFGLFRARRSVNAPLRVLVYPQVFDFAVARPRGELREGPTAPSPAQRIGEFRGAREYQPGDSLRQVHWKSSARSGRLMVKEYDRSPESQTVLFLNAGHNAGTGKETTFEYGIKLAASIARACYRSDNSFMMAPPGLGVRFPQWRAALEYLARLADGEGAPPERALASLARAGRVIAIVAATDGEGLRAVRRLPADRLAAVVLLQGFDAEHEEAGVAAALSSAGVQVVTCVPGGIQQALDELAAAGSRGARQMVRVGS
ncbi:MAG: DUF58 domain-containing protein [Chloroflexi bacterium]|nr:DUF58 domain-containing protein [Chloroflexota bacterium]